MSLAKRLKDAIKAFEGGHGSEIGHLYFGMDVKRCWECEYKNVPAIRDNLLVTAGTRAAYMHDKDIIEIPADLKGEDELAQFITRVVDEYLAGDHGNFDIWIEQALIKAYGKEESTDENLG